MLFFIHGESRITALASSSTWTKPSFQRLRLANKPAADSVQIQGNHWSVTEGSDPTSCQTQSEHQPYARWAGSSPKRVLQGWRCCNLTRIWNWTTCKNILWKTSLVCISQRVKAFTDSKWITILTWITGMHTKTCLHEASFKRDCLHSAPGGTSIKPSNANISTSQHTSPGHQPLPPASTPRAWKKSVNLCYRTVFAFSLGRVAPKLLEPIPLPNVLFDPVEVIIINQIECKNLN